MTTVMKNTTFLAMLGKLQPRATKASFGSVLWLLLLLLGGGALEVKAAAFTSCAAITEIPVTECNALKALYDNTAGPTWNDHINWLATDTPCSWAGLACSAGNVTIIDLSQNNLTGTLPDLSALTKLQQLFLNSNQLSGPLPNFNLPALLWLNLDFNQLSGAIPSFTLPNLLVLGLSYNKFNSAIPNFNLPNLQTLDLSFNLLTNTIPNFNLTKLQTLDLSSNQLSGPIPNFNLPGLQSLNLSVNQLNGGIPNFNLANLQTLDLSSNQLSGTIPLLTVPKLQKLYLSANQLTGNFPNLTSSSPNLKIFYADENQLCGDLPVWIINTSYFNLDNNYLTASNSTVKSFLDTNYPGWFDRQNSAVQFTSVPITTAWVGTLYTYSITVPKTTCNPLTITSVQSLPTWLTLTDNGNNTATLRGTPTQAGSYSVIVQVNDSVGTTNTQSFTLAVTDENIPLTDITVNLQSTTILKGSKVLVSGTLFSSKPGSNGSRPIILTLTTPDKTTRILSSSPTTNGTGEYLGEVTGLDQVGTYSLEVAFDDSTTPNSPDAARSQTFKVLETGIGVAVTTPTAQAIVKAEDGITIKGTASDNNNGAWIQKVTASLQDLGTTGIPSTEISTVELSVVGTANWLAETHEVKLTPDHSYLITAQALDLANNPSAAQTVQFSVAPAPVEKDGTLTLTPLKTRLQSPDESTVEVIAKLSVPTTTAPQNTPDLSGRQINWTLTAPDTTVTPGNATTQAGGEVRLTLSGLTQTGTYTLAAKFDGSPPLSEASAKVEIIVAPPPAEGILEIYQPLNDYTFNSLSIPVISGQATIPNVKQVQVAVQNRTSSKYLQIENLVGKFVTEETWLTAKGTSFWQLDISKAKFSNNKTYLVRARTLDANNVPFGAEVTVTFKINSLQPYTTLHLELSSATLLKGDQVNLTGKLNVYPDKNQDLTDLPIDLTFLSPNQKETVLPILTHTSTGQFKLSDFSAFDQPGQYVFTAQFPGTDDFSPSISKPQYLLIGQSAGYALLVQGKIPNGEGLSAHKKTVQRIYEKLKERGFEDDNIRYFGYDLKQKGVDAIPSKAEIESAFTDLQTRLQGSPAPFYVIMIDHGSADSQFHVNNETIDAAQLNTWLTNFENGLTTPEAQSEPRLVILGSCYSGSFIPTVSKPGRIIITSAAENEVSYKGPVEPGDSIRSGELFMEEFFQALGQGDAFTKAFEVGAEKIRIVTRQSDAKGKKDNKATTVTGSVKKRFDDDALQHPLLDDNGDGKGSNVLTVNGDGFQVASLHLGAGPNYETNFAGNSVDILRVTDTHYLLAQESSLELWTTVNNARRVNSAVVDIRKPTVTLLVDGREHTEQREIKDFSREFLSCNQQQHCSTMVNNFNDPGKYEMFYFVRDSDTTNISPLYHSVVYKDYVGNQPPLPVTLNLPANFAKSPTTLVFDWHDPNKRVDPDGEPVTYTLLIAQDEAFKHIVYHQEELRLSMVYVDSRTKVTFWKPDGTSEEQDGLKDQTTYYWKVVAVDSFGARTDSSEVWTFTTDNPNAPPGCSHITVDDSITGDPIADANIVVPSLETPPPIYPEEGNYVICLPSVVESSYELHVGSDGYEEVVIWLDVVPNTRSLHHLRSASSATFLTNKEIQNMPTLQVLLTPKQKPTLPGTIQFEADKSSANEQEGTINLVVSRVGGSDGEVTATYQLPDGTTQTLTWANGDDNPRIIKVPLGNDKQLGDNFVVKLTAVSGGATLGIVQHTINITDEPTVGKLQFQQTLVKTTDNSKPVPVMVERVGGSTGTISANYTITLKGVLVPKGTGVVSWVEGDTTPKPIEVPVDSLSSEEMEFIQVHLDTPVSPLVKPEDSADLLGEIADVAVTIIPPPPCVEGKTAQIQFSPLTSSEVFENHGNMTFTVTRTGCVESEVAVEYQVMPESTAQLGQDFSLPETSPLRWPAGDATPKQITLVSNQDEETEGDETVMLQLYNVTGGANLGMDKVTMTIKDGTIGCDKNPTKIQFAPLLLSKVSENIGPVTFTVTRTGCYDGKITVEYEVTPDSTATPGLDYTGATTGKLTWADKDDQPKTFTLTIVKDTLPEPEEEIKLQLKGENLGEPQMVSLMVEDDDEPPPPSVNVQFTQAEYQVIEGEVEYIDIPVTITRLDNLLPVEAAVVCNRGNVQESKQLEWLAQETVVKNCRVQIADDNVNTGDREIMLSLSNPYHTTQIVEPATAKLLIKEDDVVPPCTPHFTTNDVTVTEADKEIVLTIECADGADGEVTTDYQTENGTALDSEDYQSLQGTLTFTQDHTSDTVKILLVNDEFKEVDEQMVVKLSPPPPDNGQVTITIKDDDDDLPVLGCIATDNTGSPLNLDPEIARCKGGISVADREFTDNTIIKLDQKVKVVGRMTVNPQHVGQEAELVLFAGYRPLVETGAPETFFMLDTTGAISIWSHEVSELKAWQAAKPLEPTFAVTLYEGQFILPGRLTVFFGYRLEDGTVVQNDRSIEVQIDNRSAD